VGTPAGESYKCDFDVELTLEAMRAIELMRPDIVVLLCGDGDFVPLIMELRRRGIRAEVAAFLDNTSRELLLRCSGFIDLDVWLDALRKETAAQEPETDNDTAWQDLDEEDGEQPIPNARRFPATEL
jgi:uncharacterized LabA/DUF88 family protein